MRLNKRIEIFGLPGVGKTFITDNLIKTYPTIEAQIIPNRPATKRERLSDYPFYFRHWMLMHSARKEPHCHELFLRFKRIARRSTYIQSIQKGILAECGTLQPILEAFLFWENETNTPNWEALCKRYVHHHHFFLIADHLEKIVDREINRHPRRLPYPPDVVYKKYRQAQLFIEQLVQILPVTTFFISDYESLEILNSALQENIHKILSE